MTIDKEIADAIDKNLPALVGERLRSELEELPKLRAKVATLDRTIESQLATERADKSEIARQREEIRCHDAITAREAAVLKREQSQDLLALRVELANERRVEMKELVTTIFRSPVMTRTVTGSVPVALEGCPPSPSNAYGTPGFCVPGQVATTTTEQLG